MYIIILHFSGNRNRGWVVGGVGVVEISCRSITIATGIAKNPYVDTLGTSLGQLGQKLENHVRFG